MSLTRTIAYPAGRDRFGGERDGQLVRTARARLLLASPSRTLDVQNPSYQNVRFRTYLVRPDREMFTYDFDLGSGNTESRTIPLEWDQGQVFVDGGGTRWLVNGVGFYDSAGRMLEIFVSYSVIQT